MGVTRFEAVISLLQFADLRRRLKECHFGLGNNWGNAGPSRTRRGVGSPACQVRVARELEINLIGDTEIQPLSRTVLTEW
jgi:hypothetical protein